MRTKKALFRALCLCAALLLPGSSVVLAQTGGDEDSPAPEKEAPKVKVERGAGGKKTYRIVSDIIIEGRIQKPNAFYVLERSQINYDWVALKKDFLPRIVDAVTKSPF